MEFIFECEHEKINSISPSVNVLFCLSYKHTNNDVFDDFPKISEDFPKLSRRFDEYLGRFSEDCRRLPKVAEDFRGGTDDVSIIQHHLWVLFKRLCSYSNGNLKTWQQLDIFTRKIFTCENIWIFSVAEILIKHWCLYNKQAMYYYHYYCYHYYYYYYYYYPIVNLCKWFRNRSQVLPHVERWWGETQTYHMDTSALTIRPMHLHRGI